MPGLRNFVGGNTPANGGAFVLGETFTWTETVEIDGAAKNLSGFTAYLLLNDVSAGGTDLEKGSDDDTDWIEITTSASGIITLKVDKSPSGVPTTGATYRVGGWVTDGTDQHRFGVGDDNDPATWEFKVGGEGSPTEF